MLEGIIDALPSQLDIRNALTSGQLFLLYSDIEPRSWIETLRSERRAYTELLEHHLKDFFDGDLAIETPDVDPLAEDESVHTLYASTRQCRALSGSVRDPAAQD
jgi:hypothetical protein